MSSELDVKKIFASALILALIIFLIIAFIPYLKALFGAIIFYVLFRPIYRWLKFRGFRRRLAAGITILLSLLIIVVPLFVVTSLLVNEVTSMAGSAQNMVDKTNSLYDRFPSLNLQSVVEESISRTGEFLKGALLSAIGGATHAMISLIIMYFILYYMFINSHKVSGIVQALIPFNKKNRELLMEEASNVTYSVVVSTGVIAAMQGILLAVGFLIFRIPGALTWGLIGTVLAFFPIVGIPLIWVPAGIIQLILGNYVAGIGILIWGAILSSVDNFVRPALQKKSGEMHPLVSLIGVFIGIPYFGMLGLIIGPLLLSYLVLTVNMFREEYL